MKRPDVQLCGREIFNFIFQFSKRSYQFRSRIVCTYITHLSDDWQEASNGRGNVNNEQRETRTRAMVEETFSNEILAIVEIGLA